MDDDAIWTPATIALWQDWFWKDYRAFKTRFDGEWHLSGGRNRAVIFSATSLQEVMREAQAIETRRAEKERLGAKHESAVATPCAQTPESNHAPD